MDFLVIAAACFAAAAALGLYLARMHFVRRSPPAGLVLLHGLAAASGLAALIAGYLRTSSPTNLLTAALIVFVVAACGGFALLVLHLLRGAPPRFAIVGHALVALTGFALLLLVLLGSAR